MSEKLQGELQLADKIAQFFSSKGETPEVQFGPDGDWELLTAVDKDGNPLPIEIWENKQVKQTDYKD